MRLLDGYHYTSASNWDLIKIQGLVPYEIHKAEFKSRFPFGVTGIWVWVSELDDVSHLGAILWQLATKNSTQIVKLRVRYCPDHVLAHRGRPVELHHHGVIDNWQYHDNAPAVVVIVPIMARDIKFLDRIDLISRLR